MQFILNIEKKHFYLIAVMVALVGVVSFVQSQGATFGHDSSQVSVDIDGSTTTLQAAIDDGDIASDTDNIAMVYTGSSYHVQVDGSSGAFKCPDGEVLVGIKYKNGGDDHMTGMYCAPLEYEEYNP